MRWGRSRYTFRSRPSAWRSFPLRELFSSSSFLIYYCYSEYSRKYKFYYPKRVILFLNPIFGQFQKSSDNVDAIGEAIEEFEMKINKLENEG